MVENELSISPVAYFCAEFGFDPKIPIYAGGLGILAGDTIKQAADDNMPFVGVGLLYRGYATVQAISAEGVQTEENNLFDPVTVGLEHVYLDDMPLFIKVHMTEVDVWVRCWKKTFANNVTLYLLDTETDQNLPNERSITSTLYSGTQDTMLKQQIILGIGGVKLLTALGIHPSVYHMNEGRPNFLHWQLIRELMQTHNIDYKQAKETAKQKTVYTNHTLVAAGNQQYSMDLLKIYSKYYADKMGIPVEELLKDGIENSPDQYSITMASLRTSKKANGVSQIHSQLSQKNWPDFNWMNITNGVHLPTWQASEILNTVANLQELWSYHLEQKKLLEAFVKSRTGYGFDPNAMVISWARRLAGYKRMDLLFSDIERLRAIVKNESRPVQILLAGKAHQGDTAGKQLLQQIITYMKRELVGHALFIPNYDITVAQMLTRGSDLWLNTPEIGKEASGTSGMKAISNGVINLTASDGWAKEVDWNGIGFTLDAENLPDALYEQLEKTVIPLFYTRGSDGLPQKWIEMMQKSIKLSEQFSSKRMLSQYREGLYT